MHESDFAREIKQSINYLFPDAMYIKIPDSIGSRFNTLKYIDAILFFNKKLYSFEYKQHKSHRAFPLSKIRPIQEEYLQKTKNNQGAAYFVFNVRYKEAKRVDIAIFIDIDRWNILKQELGSRKSIPLDILVNAGITISYECIDGKKIWQVDRVINIQRNKLWMGVK